jgi:cell division protein FtsW
MDKLLLILTITLIGVGIVSVFDASYATELRTRHSEYLLVAKQARWAVMGLFAMLVAMRVPYWTWRKYAFPGVCAAIILLVAVLIPHLGHTINGARRWIGPGVLQLQPSEFAKLALILYLAHVCTVLGPRLKRLQEGLLPLLFVVGLTCMLIEKEPDLGTALVLCGTAMIMMYVAGARGRHLGSLLGIVSVGVLLYSVSKSYRLHRLIAFTDPKAYQLDNGYQVWHALIAIGSGGFGGRGLGDGIEKIFIPMAPTDFIFPVIAEEWGFIGALIVVTLFLLVAARGFTIAHATKDRFGSLLATGITTLIALQSVINIAVATSSIPDTGVPLPFISYGGSALLLMMTSIGLLLNISRYPDGPGRVDTPDAPPRPNERDFENRWNRRPYLPKPEEAPERPSSSSRPSASRDPRRRPAPSASTKSTMSTRPSITDYLPSRN